MLSQMVSHSNTNQAQCYLTLLIRRGLAHLVVVLELALGPRVYELPSKLV